MSWPRLCGTICGLMRLCSLISPMLHLSPRCGIRCLLQRAKPGKLAEPCPSPLLAFLHIESLLPGMEVAIAYCYSKGMVVSAHNVEQGTAACPCLCSTPVA